MAQAESVADYNAISLNVMHSSVGITDQYYSNISDNEVHNRINALANVGTETLKDNRDIEKEY